MDLPPEVPVMTLPNVILFPQAMVPLFIFEPRYRKMLAEALGSHRMFSVAMQKPGRVREVPCTVAGLGLIRASVNNKNGTSNLILQGIARVELGEVVQTKPYRVQAIRPLQVKEGNLKSVSGLTAKVRSLVRTRLEQGLEDATELDEALAEPPVDSGIGAFNAFSLAPILKYLSEIEDPEPVADIVSHTLLTVAGERQTILETADMETRLKKLIHFLMAEIERHRKDDPS